jgi:cis-L-3-hydroxyproline dehydratase
VADAERLAAVRAAVGPAGVLYADANAGWTTAAARRFLEATAGLDYTLEQPCPSIEECAALRPHCARPLVLDESVTSFGELLRCRREAGADGVTIKLARVGGITRAALLRDAACELGLTVTVEDTGGSTIDTAAMLHLSHSTPEPNRAHTVDFTEWVTVANADGLPPAADGRRAAPAGPGLGVDVRVESLGEPFFETT